MSDNGIAIHRDTMYIAAQDPTNPPNEVKSCVKLRSNIGVSNNVLVRRGRSMGHYCSID